MLATGAVGGGSRQRRVGEVHLGGVPDSVNGFLQFCFAEVEKWQNSPVFRANFFRPISPPKMGLASESGEKRHSGVRFTAIFR